MAAEHTSSFDEDDDGWQIVSCTCGARSGPLPDIETAADVWGDHMYEVGRAEGAAELDALRSVVRRLDDGWGITTTGQDELTWWDTQPRDRLSPAEADAIRRAREAADRG